MDGGFIYTRSFEIIVAIIAGSFLCYLGYRLFQIGFSEKSDLKFEYGKIKLHIFKATPGIFFSLFGSAIIVTAMWHSAKYISEIGNQDGSFRKIRIEKSLEDENLTPRGSLENKFQEALYYHLNDNIEKAESVYWNILKSSQTIGQVSNNLADILKNRGELEKALILAKYAVLVYPDSISFQRTLSQIKVMQEKK